MDRFGKILIVGCGNMGGAMLAGWLAGGLSPARFTVVDPYMAEAPSGVTLLRELPAGPFDAVLLGVKPQALDAVAPSLAPLVGGATVLLSILAGGEMDSLAARFPAAAGIVRIMPNLAAAIGKSPIALAARGLDAAARADVVALMAPLGTPEWLESEALFDALTALAGCGPAFVYRFIDSLAAGAVALGLSAGQSQRLALAMVEGAALLAARSEHAPGELARRVASPGGSTQAGLDVLDRDEALAGLVAAAMRAAHDRSAEMAQAARAQ
ncbi:pyrroline-5-carboxylate reductase family protein [Novosphingobium album (ex Liu et al. 2023)]|uniref:Pyrroline-5-carboxylate reductase n=1 Tax=Novosphingobium album (ex Liu et al. 2023) TaxID=3031130 RepID=A0ABT5WK31_9SPHN|nr:pyrroline-5-carboxylate reductase [Novosphingobium album (ex Liu et al. 2023)]MDE8650406.1 pyrroline-5-carboxylate reductase [Novosphingobium album (ex Liu et al. 2023)]